jgi:tetratricopeptide (TPR) repeat protein/tRNA A-37 threonylcarbamoyl transferase component Bud32/TolB-like protein
MGVVYRAHDAHLEREVAIKFLHPTSLSNEHSRKRFRNEARALSRLNHPNIATILDFDTHDRCDFLVMELIPGITLRDQIVRGSFPEKEILAVGIQLAEGLAAAHDHGIIHRDLTPSNLRFTDDGRIKILDFGLAKLRYLGIGSETVSDVHSLAGTLPYMAPEQVLGGEVDTRTDIHAAGIVLYEMATGLPAFSGVDRSELINAILRSSPRPATERNPNLSPELARIIAKCLEREPDNRYQSAKELCIDLRRMQSDSWSGTQPSTSPRRWRFPALWIGLTVLLAVIMVLAFRKSILRLPSIAVIPKSKQLAVLPFTVPEGDAETAAFGAGLTETLTAKLTQMTRNPDLQVVPASEVREKHIATTEVARQEFGVNLVLQGNLHKSGSQMRINFTLVDPQTRRQLRAYSLTISAGDAFRAEDEVVRGTIEMLGIEGLMQLDTPEGRGTQVAGAYDYYLQGRGYLQNYDREQNLDSAIQVFQRALALDKNYAPAYAALGEAYWQKYRANKASQWLQQSRDACRAANRLDAQLPTAHACLGNLFFATGKYADAVTEFSAVLQNEPTNDAAYKGLADSYEQLGTLPQAESTYKQAIALRPHYWAPYNWLGVFYYHQARFHEASEMFRQVVALAPDSVRGHSNLGASLMDEGLYDESIRASQRSIEIQPSDYGYMNLANSLFFLRRYDEAISAYQQSIRYSENDPLPWWGLGDGYYWAPGLRDESATAYQKCSGIASQELVTNANDSYALGVLAICQAMLGQKKSALDALSRGFQLAPSDPFLMFQAALVHNQFDQPDETLRWLSKCRAAGYPLNKIRDYPNFQPLRSDPRFEALLRAP